MSFQSAFTKDLREIAQLEEEHNLLGVSFTVREGCRDMILTAEDLAAHVLDTLRDVVETEKILHTIPFVTPVYE